LYGHFLYLIYKKKKIVLFDLDFFYQDQVALHQIFDFNATENVKNHEEFMFYIISHL